MSDPCSSHIFKMSLKQQPVVEVCTDLNEEAILSSFKVSFKEQKPWRSSWDTQKSPV